MTLQERIKNDLSESIKNRDKEKTNILKVIYGELQRHDKNLNDEQVEDILRKLINDEKENIERLKKSDIYHQYFSPYLLILEDYAPQQISENEVREWIINNIDFSQFKNKNESIKVVKPNSKIMMEMSLKRL
jgi:uncharacterized protein YqeY